MRLYLSSGMTGYADYQFPLFDEHARALREGGFFTINPADKGVVDGYTWADYMRYDIPLVVGSDGVAVFGKWWLSPGSRFEVDTAIRLGLRVTTVHDWLTGNADVDHPVVQLRRQALQRADADFAPAEFVKATTVVRDDVFDPWCATVRREMPSIGVL